MNNLDFFDKEGLYDEKDNNEVSNENNELENKVTDFDNSSYETNLNLENNYQNTVTEETDNPEPNKIIFEEENVTKKKPKLITRILKALSTAVLTIVLCIGAFLVFYVITTKIAEKNGDFPPYGMFTIISPSMQPNINVYDVVFIAKVKDYKKLKVKDVVTFYTDYDFFAGTPITHRIVQIYETDTGYRYITKGDNNPVEDDFVVTNSNIAGKVIFKIPQLGRIQFFLATKGGWFIAILVPALGILAYDLVKIIKLIVLKKKLGNIEQDKVA